MKDEISLNETMFVIGSGPSLNEIDIKQLKGLNTISLNRQYIAYDDWGFWPKYYVCIDQRLIGKIFETDILPMMRDPKCGIERFFILADKLYEQHYLRVIHPTPGDEQYEIEDPKLIQIKTSLHSKWDIEAVDKFHACCINDTLAHARWRKSNHYTPQNRGSNLFFRGSGGAFATSLAYALGYKRAVLLGVDAKYVNRQESIEAGKDLNHFHPNYFDVDEFQYDEDFGPATGYYEPWHIMVTGNHPGSYPEGIVAAIRATGNHPGPSYESPLAITQFHLCMEKSFEVVSCSPNSVINDLFEYIVLDELLKSYEVKNEN